MNSPLDTLTRRPVVAGSRALQPSPHHAGSRHGRSETPQGRIVLLIGAGGLGSPLGLYLAAAGVGRHRPRRFRRGGLQQSAAADLARHAGRGPAQAATRPETGSRQSIRRSASISTRRISHRPTPSRSSQPYDIVIDGTDNFPTRYLVNDACVLLKKPNIYGSIFRFDGQASVFYPGAGRAIAACIRNRRRPARCRAVPRAACWACCRD